MIGPGTGVRVYLTLGVTDLRKGIAGLPLYRQHLIFARLGIRSSMSTP